MLHSWDDAFSINGQLELFMSFIGFLIACYYCYLTAAVFDDRCKISIKIRAIITVLLLLCCGIELSVVIFGRSDLFYLLALIFSAVVGVSVTWFLKRDACKGYTKNHQSHEIRPGTN